MELKLNFHDYISLMRLTFNRTSMELKRVCGRVNSSIRPTFNRTSMELKLFYDDGDCF